MDRITSDIADYRVHPVEVGLFDDIDIEAPALFIGLGSSESYAVYYSRAGNQFTSVGGTATTAAAR